MEKSFVLFYLMLLSIIEKIGGTACIGRCTVSDAKLTDCWPASIDFFSENLIKAANEYSSVLLHIARWKVRHPEDVERYSNFEEDSLNRVLKAYEQNADQYENGPFTKHVMEKIFSMILNETRTIIDRKYQDETELLPPFVCPTTCDYYPMIWMFLFFTMFAVFVMACLSFTIYYCIHMRKTGYTIVDQRPVNS